MDAFLERLRTGPPIVLDGPTGTELERLGVDTATPLWSAVALLERPDDVVAVHRAYAAAGAELHTTATFRADRLAFGRAGRSESDRRRAVQAAVRAARAGAEAAGGAWVAGGIGPLGDCYAPEEVPAVRVLRDEHAASARLLVDGGVDVLLFETVNTVREAVAAVEVSTGLGVPVLVSFVAASGARLLSGEPLAAAVGAVARAGADAVLVNCCSLPVVAQAVPALAAGPLPWGVYANGSLADPRKGWTAGQEVSVEAFVDAARSWCAAGARIIGSCCGAGPRYTAALRSLRDGGAAVDRE